MNFFKYLKQSHIGFTLMEVMVAVSIFTIIVTVGIVALLTINNAHKKSQLDRQAIDSLTFVVESMSRSLRTAQIWKLVSNDRVDFLDQDGKFIIYEYVPDNNGMFRIFRTEGGETSDIVPENIKITDFRLGYIEKLGQIQSYIQINIKGVITSGQQESDVSIQTSVSKRILDVVSGQTAITP